MEPFLKAFNILNSLINDIRITIEHDSYMVEDDGLNSSMIQAVYDQGGWPMTSRYEVKIKGVYHRSYYFKLTDAFNEFKDEVNRNLEINMLESRMPGYLNNLRKELSDWNEQIIEKEVVYTGNRHWIYLNKDISTDFLNAQGFKEYMLKDISNKFLFMRSQIVDILDGILSEENIPLIQEKEIVNQDSGVENPIDDVDLDVRQTALLFYLMRKNNVIQNHTNETLSAIIHALTGHSEQNIRTIKGFGAMYDIMRDKSKDKNYSHIPNYNLNSVKDILNKILDDIQLELERNNSK